ncbi:NAD(P)-binding domain-containing protein [Actinoplanes sp. NPDC051851]|uniref:NADPH-dependent F420 reductase n=1 Tax=Actinoplanes sp. NPDC051851 TaxID=3154753 RepID=UPI0034264CC6
MTATLGLIGTGMIGSGLAHLAVAAGLNVVLSNSRDPETLSDLVAGLGPNARAALPHEAAEAGDIVVATVPFSALGNLPVQALTAKTVIDTMNYYPQRDGTVADLDAGMTTSSELVQRHLARSQVVKAFNNIDFRRLSLLALRSGAPERSALPIFGDDPDAKADATRLLDELGFDAVDGGSLADSWRTAPGTPAYVLPYLPERQEGMTAGAQEAWFYTNPGCPVPATRIRELVAAAVRLDPTNARMTLQQ